MIRVIMAGGRDYRPTPRDRDRAVRLLQALGATLVVSCMARGVATWGEGLAAERGLLLFSADWPTQGRRAGWFRNLEMAANADAVITLRGGRGTAMMRAVAREAGLPLFDLRLGGGRHGQKPSGACDGSAEGLSDRGRVEMFSQGPRWRPQLPGGRLPAILLRG